MEIDWFKTFYWRRYCALMKSSFHSQYYYDSVFILKINCGVISEAVLVSSQTLLVYPTADDKGFTNTSFFSTVNSDYKV